jgi:hypothetical protein
MSRCLTSLLYWSPRVLGIAFALFLSFFALDVFREAHGLWSILSAFSVHLIPAAIVSAVLVIAWRHEWVAAVLFALAAAFYAWTVLPAHLDWALLVAGPLAVIAGLFFLNWVERGKLRARRFAVR